MANPIKINAKEHKVAGVTVYQSDRAVIQRRFPVDLKDGQNEVSISRLPVVLEGDSIRVEVATKSASHGLTVFDVIHVPPSYDHTKRYDAGSELEELREQSDALEARLSVLEKQKNILGSFGDSIRANDDANNSRGASLDTLESFLDVYSARHGKIYEETQRIAKEKAEIQAKITEIEKRIHSEREQSRFTGVTVVLLAEEDGPAELVLSYLVRKASWTSLYDVRADLTSQTSSDKKTTGPTIALQYRANITQDTGEDWEGVALTLSTASPLLGSDIPVLQPWKIGQYRKPAPVMMAAMSYSSPRSKRRKRVGGFAARKQHSSDLMALDDDDESESYEGASGPQVTVSEGAISSTFGIEGFSTIPSDNSSHKVSIATIDLLAELEWVTVPRNLPSAFLQCRIKNTSSYQLISGPSNVFMDGNFVSKSRVPDVAPQETFSCSLGVDPSVRVTYHPLSKVKSTTGGGLMSTKNNVTSYKQRITIKNARKTEIVRLIVKDHVPLSEDAKIKVNVLQPSEKALGPPVPSSSTGNSGSTLNPASLKGPETLYAQVNKNVVARWAQKEEENGGRGGSREDGVLEWIGTNLKDTLDLELAYEVIAPSDMTWTNV